MFTLFYTNFIHDCDIIFWLISIKISEYISAFSRETCGMTSTGSLLSDPLDVWSSSSFWTDLFGERRDCGFGLFLEPFGRPLFRFIGIPCSSSWTGCNRIKVYIVQHTKPKALPIPGMYFPTHQYHSISYLQNRLCPCTH